MPRNRRGRSALIDPQTLMRIKSLRAARARRRRRFLQGHASQPVSRLLGRVHRVSRSTPPATIRATSTGGSSPAPTATTSSDSRTKPTCAATCSSTPAARWATARSATPRSTTPAPRRRRSPTSSSPQRDAVGLVTFDDRIVEYLPARSSPGPSASHHGACSSASPPGQATDLAGPLEQIAATVRKRGLVVLLSDLLGRRSALKHAWATCARAGTTSSCCGSSTRPRSASPSPRRDVSRRRNGPRAVRRPGQARASIADVRRPCGRGRASLREPGDRIRERSRPTGRWSSSCSTS